MLPNGILVALETMLLVLLEYPSNTVTLWWYNKIQAARSVPWKGRVQDSFSDPLAFWVVSLAGSNGKGFPFADRNALEQFRFALKNGLTAKADKPFRSVNHQLAPLAQEAGLFRAVPKRDSDWGTVSDRLAATAASRNSGQRRIAPETINVMDDIVE